MTLPSNASAADTFPRQYARTQRLTLGEPRNIVVSPDGARVVFVRSRSGSSPVNELWWLDVESGEEHLVVLPLDGGEDGDLPAQERARRERAREGAGGIVAFATDRAVTVAAFALGGRLFAAGLLEQAGAAAGCPRSRVRPAPGSAGTPDRVCARRRAVARRARWLGTGTDRR